MIGIGFKDLEKHIQEEMIGRELCEDRKDRIESTRKSIIKELRKYRYYYEMIKKNNYV